MQVLRVGETVICLTPAQFYWYAYLASLGGRRFPTSHAHAARDSSACANQMDTNPALRRSPSVAGNCV